MLIEVEVVQGCMPHFGLGKKYKNTSTTALSLNLYRLPRFQAQPALQVHCLRQSSLVAMKRLGSQVPVDIL